MCDYSTRAAGARKEAEGIVPRKTTAAGVGLFPSEHEIARRLGQDPASWAAKAAILERDGFPTIDPLMGGRYWPACTAWFDRRYGLAKIEVLQPDGGENLDALK